MPSDSIRFSQLRWLHNAACVVSMIGSFVLMGFGLIEPDFWMIAAGGLWLFLAVVQMTVMPLLVKMEATLARQLGEVRDLQKTISKYAEKLDAIAENTRISDAAKSLAHREQDVEAFRAAIRDDVRQEKWDAALKLVDDMERRFGYMQEAATLRKELDDERNTAIQQRLDQVIGLIERHFQSYEWARAQNEIDRLVHALPHEVKVASLIERMKALKERHKQELMRGWDEAVRRSDVDQAINVLKELDQYMSSAEAESLQTSARDVFKKKLLQLGVQFRFAVAEKRWQDSLTTGLELVREFPNSRMAGEVREALDTLRDRARLENEAAAAGAPQPLE